jgi:hypothetical protein
MARSNLSHGSLRFESAVIIHRLRSYRPIDQHLFVVPRVLIPEPGPDDDGQVLTISDRKVATGAGETHGHAL